MKKSERIERVNALLEDLHQVEAERTKEGLNNCQIYVARKAYYGVKDWWRIFLAGSFAVVVIMWVVGLDTLTSRTAPVFVSWLILLAVCVAAWGLTKAIETAAEWCRNLQPGVQEVGYSRRDIKRLESVLQSAKNGLDGFLSRREDAAPTMELFRQLRPTIVEDLGGEYQEIETENTYCVRVTMLGRTRDYDIVDDELGNLLSDIDDALVKQQRIQQFRS